MKISGGLGPCGTPVPPPMRVTTSPTLLSPALAVESAQISEIAVDREGFRVLVLVHPRIPQRKSGYETE